MITIITVMSNVIGVRIYCSIGHSWSNERVESAMPCHFLYAQFIRVRLTSSTQLYNLPLFSSSSLNLHGKYIQIDAVEWEKNTNEQKWKIAMCRCGDRRRWSRWCRANDSVGHRVPNRNECSYYYDYLRAA